MISSEETNLPLDSLGLSPRVLHALQRIGINTIGDAVRIVELRNRIPMFYIPNYGKKSHEELVSKLKGKGVLLCE